MEYPHSTSYQRQARGSVHCMHLCDIFMSIQSVKALANLVYKVIPALSMYKKLIYFGIFVFLVPILFVLDNKYITGLGWFGIEVMHGVQYHGIQLFFCLLVISVFMFFMGLAHPKVSIWFGEKTRKRSSIIYGVVLGIAIVGLIEVNLIASGIYEYEDRTMVSFYEAVEIGSSFDEVKNLSTSLNKHLGYSDSLAQREKDLIAYDQNRYFVEFTFPNPFRTRRVIVETDLHLDREGGQIIGKYLLINNRITRSEN